MWKINRNGLKPGLKPLYYTHFWPSYGRLINITKKAFMSLFKKNEEVCLFFKRNKNGKLWCSDLSAFRKISLLGRNAVGQELVRANKI